MHEVGIMQSAIEMAVSHAQLVGAEKILRMRLRIGELSGVVPEALELAFAAASPGTPAAGALFEIERIPVECRCVVCQENFHPEDSVYMCPKCGAINSQLEHGRELELASLEVS